jgi:hypothetical protein
VNRDGAHGAGHVLNVENSSLRSCGKSRYRQANEKSSEQFTHHTFLSAIEEGQNTGTDYEQKHNRKQRPKQNSLHLPSTISNTVIANGAALRHQIKFPEGQPEKQDRQNNKDGPVGFECSQMRDPGTTNAHA